MNEKTIFIQIAS
jgi:hypothetical protein